MSSGEEVHPRLFFNRDGLEKLRVKATSDQGKQSIDAVVGYAKVCIKTPVPKASDYRLYLGHLEAAQFLVCDAETLAFSYLMTGDETYARTSKEYILSLRAWESWQDFPDDDLSMAFICRGLSVVYDWLYQYLTPEDRATFKGMVERSAGWLYSESMKEKQWWTKAYAQNQLAISHACLGLAGLTFMGEHLDAEKWVDIAKLKIGRYLDNGCPDGAWGEGLNYWNFGTYQILIFLDALRFAGKTDLFQHWWLRVAWQFPFYCLSPTRKGLVNFCDCNYDTAPGVGCVGVTMLKLASEYRNQYAQWFAKVTSAWTKTGLNKSPWNFIWYDPALAATEPTSLPVSKLFRGVGWGVFRTGWTDNDTLFALRAGSWWLHNHADQNGFVLESLGERLVIDPGYGKIYDGYFTNTKDPYVGSIGHNTVLVDDSGQQPKQDSRRPSEGGHIRSFINTSNYDYLLGDASATYPYPLQLFTRQVTFMKPSYFVMCDELVSAKASLFTWLLHSAGKIEVKGDTVLVRGNKASLIIEVLSPQKWIGQILYDQRHMIGWEKEQPIQYIKIEPLDRVERVHFLLVIVPVSSQMGSTPFSITRISEASVLGAAVSGDDVFHRHLYALTRGKVAAGKIEFEGRNCFVSSKAERDIQQFALHEGTFLKFNTTTLVSSSKPLNAVVALESDLAEGIVETSEDCTLEMTAQEKPVMVILNGSRFTEYVYDPQRRMLTFSLRKGFYSLKVWWQCYQGIQQLLLHARERYEQVRGRTLFSPKAMALVENSHGLIQEATQAFEQSDLERTRTLCEEALKLLEEAMITEQTSLQSARTLVTTTPTTTGPDTITIYAIIGLIVIVTAALLALRFSTRPRKIHHTS